MTVVMESSWRWCSKCLGLWFAGTGTAPSVCPADHGNHALGNTLQYVLCKLNNEPLPTNWEQSWAWCQKCRGLFFSGSNKFPNFCPAGGAHDGSESANYALVGDWQDGGAFPAAGTWPGQGQNPGWLWCSQCQGLYQIDTTTNGPGGACPNPNAPNHQHQPADPSWRGKYTLSYGPFPEKLTVVFQDPDTSTYRMATSADGGVANLYLQSLPIFQPTGPQGQGQAGSIIGVTQSAKRFWFTAVSTHDYQTVNLASIGIDGSVSWPQATGLTQVSTYNSTDPSSPAITYCGPSPGQLYLFSLSTFSWEPAGDTWVVPITIDSQGGPGFSLGTSVKWDGDHYSGGRITAATSVSGSPPNVTASPWCAYVKPQWPGGSQTLYWAWPQKAPNSTDPWTNWTAGSNYLNNHGYRIYNYNTSSGCAFALPNGNPAYGFPGTNGNGTQISYFDVQWAASPSVAIIDAAANSGYIGTGNNPAIMTAADGSCVYVAWAATVAGGNSALYVWSLTPDLTTIIDETTVDLGTSRPLQTPTLLTCLEGGIPNPAGG